LRIWSKKILDTRYQIPVTRCVKRSKKILDSAVFGVQVATHLVEMRTASGVQRTAFSVDKWMRVSDYQKIRVSGVENWGCNV